MTTSILSDCLLLKSQPLEKIKEYFSSIGVICFQEVMEKYANEPEHAKQIVLFILCAYSEESPLIILRNDDKEQKQSICEYLQIPEFLRNNLFTLADTEVRKATTNYLTQFAGPLFKTYCFLRIQYADNECDITNREFRITKTKEGKEGEPDEVTVYYDWKEHSKANTELIRLSKEILKVEDQIKTQLKKLRGIEDVERYLEVQKTNGKKKSMKNGAVEALVKRISEQ